MSDPVKDRIVNHDQGNDIIAKLQAIATALTNGFSNYLPLAGGTLTGTVNGVNPAATDNSAKLATTKYVKDNVPASVGSGTKPVYTNSNGKIVASNSNVGDTDTPVYMSGGTITSIGATLFSKIVSHLASATAASISSINTSSLFYRFLTWALTASGVQYNLSNSSAWYICLGSLFGGLIIQGGKRTQTQSAWGLSALPVNPVAIYSVFTSSLPGTAGPLIVTPHTDNASYAILFSTDGKGTVEEISYIAFCKAA